MQNSLKTSFPFFAFVSLLFSCFMMSSCGNDAPMYLNSEEELRRVQAKIDDLVKGTQIDSLSLRSTARNSELSSILIIATDEKDEGEMKKTIEFIPKQKLNLKEKSNLKKDALHSFKINVPGIMQYIDKAKNMLPAGYLYVDVNNIMYAASPFGEKYYFVLEVAPKEEYISNDFVEVFYSQSNFMAEQLVAQSANVADAYYVIEFLLQDGNLQMVKR